MPTSQAFWDKAAAKYDAKTVKGPNYAARLERAATWAGADARVLDVGCAGGHITLDLAPRVGRIHGIDISPKLIEIAERRRAETGVANASFAVGTADDAGLTEGSFDAITAYSVLHLVDDAAATVRRFHSLLKPGGRLIAEAPCREELHAGFRMLIAGMRWVGKAPAVRVYRQSAYEAMLREAGFEVDEVKVYNPKSMSRSFLATKPIAR